MTGEVRYWFEQAMDVPAAGRAAFLEAGCADDAVRSEVLSLLRHDSRDTVAGTYAVRRVLTSVMEQSSVPVRRVGAFELGRLLGSGGMGLVYEAHRVDGEVRQRAAVKFAQVSPVAGEELRRTVYRRFLRERQVLASLNHPCIAGLIDAGTTPDGVPFAVLEQVEGIPIDQWCDNWLPDRADRIRLVLRLCDAVQCAHRSLIVHGDIKPDNVLVTADGIPKLIDFGASSDLADDGRTITLHAFTPGYASPEQRAGTRPTVVSDVYGLAAVLYRLLTGSQPGPVRGGRTHEDIIRPSAIRPDLKGDLENILLKALHCEPGRRYGSVPEFADDLNRFLERRPVRATPDSVWYRTRRFALRHWLPVSATGLVVLSLAGVAALTVHGRREALARAAETRRLADKLLFDIHDDIGGVLGATRARQKLGELAVQYLEAVGREDSRDPELAWELLNAYARLGQSRGGASSSTGDTAGGSEFAAKTLALGAVVESSHPGTERLDALFAVYEGVVPILFEGGRRSEQREAIDRMLRLATRLHPLREAQALKQLARYFDENGQPREAAETWRRALTLLRAVSQMPDRPAGTEAHLTSTLVGFGRAQALAGDFAGAVSSLHAAVRLSESRLASEPHMARSARHLYWSYIALGDVLGSPSRFSLGRIDEAAEHYRKAQRIAERLAGADAGNEMARLDLARAYIREGAALAAGKPADALTALERAGAIAARASSQNHTALDLRLASATGSVEALVRLRRMEAARAQLAQARRLAEEMRSAGAPADENSVAKAEELWLRESRRRREALVAAQALLQKVAAGPRPVLHENFAEVDLLQRVFTDSRGIDRAACESAADRLTGIWDSLRAGYPHSGFVRGQAERARTLRDGC